MSGNYNKGGFYDTYITKVLLVSRTLLLISPCFDKCVKKFSHLVFLDLLLLNEMCWVKVISLSLSSTEVPQRSSEVMTHHIKYLSFTSGKSRLL